jgi:hypothetical protein
MQPGNAMQCWADAAGQLNSMLGFIKFCREVWSRLAGIDCNLVRRRNRKEKDDKLEKLPKSRCHRLAA